MNEKRMQAVKTYFEKIDSGTLDDAYFNLFTEEVVLYFPKFGSAIGKKGLKEFGARMGRYLKYIKHDIEGFNYITADPYIVVEGNERGETTSGIEWPDQVISTGKFSNVFEFEKDLIKRVSIYADPDFTSADLARVAIFSQTEKHKIGVEAQTRQVVEKFYNITSGKVAGNVADLFADEVDWDLPGNTEKFSWVGKRSSRAEVAGFFEHLKQNIKSEKFEIEFVAFNGENAVSVGNLSSNILKYNQVFDTAFTVNFKVRDGKIVKYHFLEDSYKLDKMFQ